MSVLIKDMKMPKSCKSCDLLQDYDGDMYCPLNSYLNFGDIEYVPDYVMLGCPISEVPERKKETQLLEKREWIEGYENRWYRKKFYCASCGIKIRTESWNEKRCFGEGTILKDNNMPNFCPNCGAEIEG